MSAQTTPKPLMFRWTTLKGLIAMIIFIVIAIILEYAVVLYAVSLGVPDYLLQWSFTFPGTSWTTTLAISPLFHLVPIAVIISLVTSWAYLTRQMARQPSKPLGEKVTVTRKKREGVASRISHGIDKFFRRIKTGLLKIKGINYLWNKIHFARATLKSALTVFLVFAALVLIFSFFAYPRLIFDTVSNAYRNDPGLLGFIKATGSGIGSVLGFINGGLILVAPGFRGFALSFGAIITPIADLDNAGKYMFFQNAAAWFSAFFAIFYAEYSRRSYRRKRLRKG